MDVSSRLRKRVRPPKNSARQQSRPESSETQYIQHQRDQTSTAPAGPQTSSSAPPGVKRAKRVRPPKGGQQQTKASEPEAEETDNDNEPERDSSAPRRSRRNHHSSDNSPLRSENRGENGSLSQQMAGKRKRPIRLANDDQPDEETESRPDPEAEISLRAQKKKRKRGGPSQNGQPSADAAEPEPASTQKKRDGPSRSTSGNGGSGTRLRKGPSQLPRKAADESHAASKQSRFSGARRNSKSPRRSSGGQDQSLSRSSSPKSDSPPPYMHIAKQTQQVTHDVIESKWSSLEPSSVANIATLLYSVSQPTLLHVVPKQYTHAEDIIEKVIRGLCRRSGKLPFPPASTLPRREDELDFEQTQTAVESLLSQLDPLQHSVELLRREKERAEKDLEREYQVLDQLSTNARAEARERKDQLRKVHDLVPATTYGSSENNIHLLSAEQGAGQVFAGIQDDELLALAGQISNHMESMRGNLQQIDGVLPAIAESQALLKTTLQPHFGQKQLENLLLGRAEPWPHRASGFET
ncbi:CENP-Q, a CENPA-CAD centromere complex subunit-domain-containing protein [Xylaria intraflava]|nr:CENP-Q, a CENPA-CAD centromere complex subunit-domain-containing protein [Xylaria intraflava]